MSARAAGLRPGNLFSPNDVQMAAHRVPACVVLGLLIVSFSIRLHAQALEFGGYFEHQLYPQSLAGEVALLDYNKLRVDLWSDASDNLTFNGDFVIQTYHGFTALNAFDFVPQETVEAYSAAIGEPPERLRPFFGMTLEDEIYLDNAYVTYYGPGFQVRAGKQQLPWGSGYAWNPTDIFHDKNLLDPTYEKRGANALKIGIPMGGMGMATAAFGPGKTWKSSIRAVRLSQHVAGFDIALMAGWLEERSTDYFTFQKVHEKRTLLGGDFSGELAGAGIWCEGAYSWMERRGNHTEVLIGLDYTFESGLYLMAEAYHNGAGASEMAEYTFDAWMRLLSNEGVNIGRDFILAGNTYPVADLLMWSNFVIVSVTDGSVVFYPYVEWSVNDNTALTLIGYAPFGQEGSEFGSFGAGGIARVRVYF